MNTLSNAHQALRETRPPRRLALTTHFDSPRGLVGLKVVDSGPGIPPEIQARIFEAFFTTKPAG